MFSKISIYILCFLPLSVLAENRMPCENIKAQLESNLSYYNKNQTSEFLRCVSMFRVCAVADNQVVSANSIKSIRSNREATTLVIIQSLPNDRNPQCLVGIYSGGSAATWIFKAFKISNGKAIAYKGMNKAYARGDAVSPKNAAITTYNMFEKYAEKQP